MVRINLINPKYLTDQHLIAEYNEILMLFGHVRKYPLIKNMPQKYVLGSGHITFFKNKLLYLQKRHELIKVEMRKRGFMTLKKISLAQYDRVLCNDWKPLQEDIVIIKRRLKQKIMLKPTFYRYYHEHKSQSFLIGLIKDV